MAKAKPKDLGTVVDVPEGGTVTRPDGVDVVVTGGTYVLNQSGDYTVDGATVSVGDADDTTTTNTEGAS